MLPFPDPREMAKKTIKDNPAFFKDSVVTELALVNLAIDYKNVYNAYVDEQVELRRKQGQNLPEVFNNIFSNFNF